MGSLFFGFSILEASTGIKPVRPAHHRVTVVRAHKHRHSAQPGDGKRDAKEEAGLYKLIAAFVLMLCAGGCDATSPIDVASHVELTPVQPLSGTVGRLHDGRKQTIVCYGTSLTAGGTWVRQLTDTLDSHYPGLATVINSGKGGMWSKWGVENLEERVIAHDSDAVLIEFSINDAYLDYGATVTQSRANLEMMISRIHADNSDAEVILLIMNPPLGVPLKQRPRIREYEAMYRDVASTFNVRLIDCSRSWQSLIEQEPGKWQQLVPDDIHPNELGCVSMVTPCILRGLGIPPTKANDITPKALTSRRAK